jgi:hypothetical protein
MLTLSGLVSDTDPLNNISANRYVYKMLMRKQNLIFK